MKRIPFKIFSILLISSCLSGCGSQSQSSSSPNIASIDISPPSPSIPQGNGTNVTIHFTAIARDAIFNGIPGVNFAWSSNDHNVACMDASGVATAQGNGSATISATAGGITATTLLTVNFTGNSPPFPPLPPTCL
jgi:uncharacterized protein YjdB